MTPPLTVTPGASGSAEPTAATEMYGGSGGASGGDGGGDGGGGLHHAGLRWVSSVEAPSSTNTRSPMRYHARSAHQAGGDGTLQPERRDTPVQSASASHCALPASSERPDVPETPSGEPCPARV